MLDLSNGMKVAIAAVLLCVFASADFFGTHRLATETDLVMFLSGVSVLSNGVIANVAHGVGVVRGLAGGSEDK